MRASNGYAFNLPQSKDGDYFFLVILTLTKDG